MAKMNKAQVTLFTAGTAGTVHKVNPKFLEFKEGFNPRDYNAPNVVAKIQEFKAAYQAGNYIPPIEVYIEGEHMFVVEGHQRSLAAYQCLEEDPNFMVDVVLFEGDEVARLQRILTAQDGIPLKPMEKAVVIWDLHRSGQTAKELSVLLKETPAKVMQLLKMEQVPNDIKDLLHAGSLSISKVCSVMAKHPQDYVDVLLGEKEEKVKKNPVEAIKAIVDAALLNLGGGSVEGIGEVHRQIRTLQASEQLDLATYNVKASVVKALLDIDDIIHKRGK